MDNREYRKLRKAVMLEYDSGILGSKELGERLFCSTNTYRKANNIAKSGNKGVLSVPETGVDNGYRHRPEEKLYFLYKEKKMANLPDHVIAQMLNISRTVLSRGKNNWIEMGWLKIVGKGKSQEVIFIE